MNLAVLFAFASATLLGAGVVTAQFGVRDVEPLSGASISVPSFTLLFILLSPLILHGEPVVWRALPIFAAIGLVFPALLTLLTFASNRALGPVATSTLGNLAPLFAAVRHGPITLVAQLVAIYPLVTVVLSSIMLKHVQITPRIVAGTVLSIAGVALVLIG